MFRYLGSKCTILGSTNCKDCTSTHYPEYSTDTVYHNLVNQYDIIGETLEKRVGTSYNKWGITTTPYKNKLENIFAGYGFDRGYWSFRAFGNPKTLNVRVACTNKEKQYFLSTKELKEHSYRLGNIPNYVKKVLDKIVEKYMSMDDFQFMQFITVGHNIQPITVCAKKLDIFYCPKHRRDVHVSKCRTCKYMHDILPTSVTCLLPDTAIIIRHKPISKIKHLNK